MGSKPALVLLTVLSPFLLVALTVESPVAVVMVIPMICALPVLLIVASGKRGQVPTGFLLLLWLILTGSWTGLWWLSLNVDLVRPSVEEATLVLGLMLVGLGLLPLLLVGLIYAWTSWRLDPSGEVLTRPGGGRKR